LLILHNYSLEIALGLAAVTDIGLFRSFLGSGNFEWFGTKWSVGASIAPGKQNVGSYGLGADLFVVNSDSFELEDRPGNPYVINEGAVLGISGQIGLDLFGLFDYPIPPIQNGNVTTGLALGIGNLLQKIGLSLSANVSNFDLKVPPPKSFNNPLRPIIGGYITGSIEFGQPTPIAVGVTRSIGFILMGASSGSTSGWGFKTGLGGSASVGLQAGFSIPFFGYQSGLRPTGPALGR
jgi:hypothetical protein